MCNPEYNTPHLLFTSLSSNLYLFFAMMYTITRGDFATKKVKQKASIEFIELENPSKFHHASKQMRQP